MLQVCYSILLQKHVKTRCFSLSARFGFGDKTLPLEPSIVVLSESFNDDPLPVYVFTSDVMLLCTSVVKIKLYPKPNQNYGGFRAELEVDDAKQCRYEGVYRASDTLRTIILNWMSEQGYLEKGGKT